MKYYTVETLAMSIDPNRDYTIEEIAGLYSDYLCNLDVECLGVIKPENTVKHIQKMLKAYKQHKAGK